MFISLDAAVVGKHSLVIHIGELLLDEEENENENALEANDYVEELSEDDMLRLVTQDDVDNDEFPWEFYVTFVYGHFMSPSPTGIQIGVGEEAEGSIAVAYAEDPWFFLEKLRAAIDSINGTKTPKPCYERSACPFLGKYHFVTLGAKANNVD